MARINTVNINDVSYDIGINPNAINYSTDEQDTGLKWVDGKNVYQKTLDLTSVSQNQIIAQGIESFVGAYGCIIATNGNKYAVPFKNRSMFCAWYKNGTNLKADINVSTSVYRVTIRYTKP